ncbi:GNAT family N-acetyltransferase [Clostridium brassicae]|uniref:GNAT family N-acetyltransferase n=1 Tax=Clostridium brassicae TaxID=2999072 RepID=A0ABT4DE07_9CLOT|nr:GNAT family N-acetyltransferase [Clostridium brassicae]MCY6960545.1 GNAT family N-acetyltransferase [Clostridium brassicae]
MRTQIKDATVKDIESISNIYALSWKVAYKGIIPKKYLDELKSDFWVETFQNWINNKTFNVKQICEGNITVGCIIYGKSRDEKLSKWGEIVSIYIHPKYFRKGYGQKLLDIALMDMKKSGYDNSYLWVLKENKDAQLFYEKNGFKCNQDEYNFEIMGKKLIDTRYVIDLNSL